MKKIRSFIFENELADTRQLISCESVSLLDDASASECLEELDQEDQLEITSETSDIYTAAEETSKESLTRPQDNNSSESMDQYSKGKYSHWLSNSTRLLPERSPAIACLSDRSTKVQKDHFLRKPVQSSSISEETWSFLLRAVPYCSLRNIKVGKKIWRPIVVKLEDGSLKFYAQNFESSSPFKIVPLVWFHVFSKQRYQEWQGEQMLTTVLLDTLQASRLKRQSLVRSLTSRKTVGQKVAKIGSINHKVLLHFIATVQRCIFSLPAFRQRGIWYRNDRVLIDIEAVHGVVQGERGEEVMATSEVNINVKARVSASPTCTLSVNRSESCASQPLDAFFHNCVRDGNVAVGGSPITATFVPLDNCRFLLLHLKSSTTRPAPLRCEVTISSGRSNSLKLFAQILSASSARMDAAAASNVTVRFSLSRLKLGNQSSTARRNTSVTKGKVRYSLPNETLVWSIPKLSLKTHKIYHRTPLGCLTANLKPVSCLNSDEMAKTMVEMDFLMNGTRATSEIDVSQLTLGHKKIGEFKTHHSKLFHILIPVQVSDV